MGLFSKIKKSLKKIVKKVGGAIKKVAKGIGKVMGKIAKPFAKFGILGQIALSFVMPWAIGGLMSGMGALAGNAFGTFASNLATTGSNIFLRTAGKLAQGIHYGAAAVNKAYTFVSDGITKGLDWVGQQGAKLKKGITNTFDGAKEWITGGPSPDLATIDLSKTTAGIADGVTGTVIDTSKLKFDPIEAATGPGIDMSQVGSKVSILDTNKIAADTIAEQSKNTLQRHGDKLISGGTETAKKVFTFDTAKNEVVKAANAQEAARVPSYEEGPTVAYLEQPLNKISQDYDFSIKAAGGQYMGPADSAIVLDTYKEIMSQYDVRTARAV